MRFSTRITLAAALASAIVVAPLSSTAIPRTQTVQCSGAATPGGAAAVCSAPFVLDESRDPQDIGTHANFHALTSMGTVEMEWFDQTGARVAHWVCQAPGLYVHRPTPMGLDLGGGPTDASAHTCRVRVSNAAPFAIGPQLLVVTAKAKACQSGDSRSCPFHGLLALKRVSEPV